MLILTQDTEFAILPAHVRGKVILSRVSQSRPIMDRVDHWFRALEAFLIDPPTGHVFEVFDSGVVAAVRMGEHIAPDG